MAGWDPSAWFSGGLDPSQIGKNKSVVQGPQGTAPAVQGPQSGPVQVGQPTNTGVLPTQELPTTGPGATTIKATPGPSAAMVDTSNVRQVGAFNAGQGGAAQSALMQQLAGQANGTAPSVSGMQLQQGQNANLAATMAQLNSSRGAANPLMQRQAMQQGSDSQAAMNQQAAINRLQEQQGAQGLLGSVAGQSVNQNLGARAQDVGLRQQDLGIASQNAANQQQAGLAGYQGNLQTNLGQAQIEAGNSSQLFAAQQQAAANNAGFQQGYNSLGAQYAGMGQQAQMANQQAATQYQQLAQQAQQANQNAYYTGQGQNQSAQVANSNIAQQNANTSKTLIGGLMNAGASVGGALAMAPAAAAPAALPLAGAGGAAAGSAAGAGGGALSGAGQAWAGGALGAGAGVGAGAGEAGAGLAAAGAEAAPVVAEGAPLLLAAAHGGVMPGYAMGGQPGGYAAGKASVSGDSTKNDKIPAWISPGEVVLPRTVVNASDPIEAFKTFMSTVHQKPIGASSTEDNALKTVMEAQSRIRSAK